MFASIKMSETKKSLDLSSSDKGTLCPWKWQAQIAKAVIPALPHVALPGHCDATCPVSLVLVGRACVCRTPILFSSISEQTWCQRPGHRPLGETCGEPGGIGWKLTEGLISHHAHTPHLRASQRCRDLGTPVSQHWPH